MHLHPDAYTYHHLRRDAFNLAQSAGANVESRYVVPSAHIALGRYLDQEDHATPEFRERWIRTIESINDWLEAEVWGHADGDFAGEWVVGQERGLDARQGMLRYGGGRTIMTGEGVLTVFLGSNDTAGPPTSVDGDPSQSVTFLSARFALVR